MQAQQINTPAPYNPGFQVMRVDVELAAGSNDPNEVICVTVHRASSGNPGDQLGDEPACLTSPGGGVQQFRIPGSPVVIQGNGSYFVVVYSSKYASSVRVRQTNTGAVDSGGRSNWQVRNRSNRRPNPGTSWTSVTAELKIAMRGCVTPETIPAPTNATGEARVNGARISWTRPAGICGGHLADFEWRQSIDGTTWTDWTRRGTPFENRHTATGLTNGTEYQFEVRALHGRFDHSGVRSAAVSTSVTPNPEFTLSITDGGLKRGGDTSRLYFGVKNGTFDSDQQISWTRDGGSPLSPQLEAANVTLEAGENRVYGEIGALVAGGTANFELPEKTRLDAVWNGNAVAHDDVMIHDNDEQPEIRLRSNKTSIEEGQRVELTIEASPHGWAQDNVQVNLKVNDPTDSLENNDDQVLTFNSGQTTKKVRFRASDDTDDEGDYEAHFRLERPTRSPERDLYSLADDHGATVTVLDDDTSSWNVSVEDAQAREEHGHIDFPVKLDSRALSTLKVEYRTIEGSAKNNVDYQETVGTLTFKKNDRRKTIRVPLIHDSHEDDRETFKLELHSPNPSSKLSILVGRATGTIRNTEEEGDPLTASFSGMPDSHDGSRFTFNLSLSDEPETDFRYRTLRDEAFDVANGEIRRAQRQNSGSDRNWTITVEPDGDDDVTITLPATTSCSASGAICTEDDRMLSNSNTDTVDGPPSEPLTASFAGMPAEHDGSSEFTFTLTFSEEPDEDLSYRTLRDDAFDVSGGDIGKAKRAQQGSNRTWTIHVDPDGAGDVSIRLPATQSCSATGAICTGDGRMLSNSTSDTVRGPAGISVADTTAEENTDASIDFTVSLDRGASGTVTVDYETANGTATAGSDYTAASGTLTFAAGERTKTVSVDLLDDTHDEGEETFTLTLSNASGAFITDSEATGTIENHDPMPRALLARFGRAAAVHVVEHVEERLQAPREPGFQGRFAGRELRKGMERDVALGFLSQLGGTAGMGPVGGSAHGGRSAMVAAGAPGAQTAGLGTGAGLGMAAATAPLMAGGMSPGAMRRSPGRDGMLGGSSLLRMGLGGGDILTGSAFALNRETKSGGILSFWSRGAQSSFAGREGVLSLNGDVRTTMLGADYAKGRMVTGLSLARSMSLGGYSARDGRTGRIVGDRPLPVARLPADRTRFGVGRGRLRAGSLLLTPGADMPLESALSMAMAAGGTRGDLIAGGTGGFALAFKADALWVGTSIDGVDGPAGRLKATGAAVTRFRTGLEGSRDYALGNVLSLKPLVEVGLRHDGGDAETGAGMDVGGGVMVASPGTGLAVDLRVRMLLVHQAEGFSERGMSVSLSYNPTPSTPLGFSARVAPTWGGQTTGGAEALWGRETMAGMAHGGVASGNRLDGEVGYGLPVGSRFVGTPRIGLTTSEYGQAYRLGYGMTLIDKKALGFELGVDAERRESPAAGRTDTGVLGRATVRW